MNTLLLVRHLSKSYGGVSAVRDVDLEVREGEFLTFLGPSGSGKSTLLYMIAGIEAATSGDIEFGGKSLLAMPPHKRDFGMVFQRYTLFPTMTIDENIAFPLRARGWDRHKIESRVDEMLALVRMQGFRGRRPDQLSGGQQQRIALARALAYHPRMLLMDEPLAALDKKLKEEIQVEIRRIHRETGVTILYVTHDQEEAIRLADRIAVFSAGRIEQIAAPDALYEQPATRFVAGFVGNSNFLSARIASGRGGTPVALLPDGSAIENAQLQDGLAVGDAADVLLRPEQLVLCAVGEPHSVAVTVRDITYLGEALEVVAETNWGQFISARLPRRTARAVKTGDMAALSWASGPALVFVPADSNAGRA